MNGIKTLMVVLCLLFGFNVLGHSGRTDKYGGHHDRIHGGYHFHHGMGPHQHPGGICPYSIPKRYDIPNIPNIKYQEKFIKNEESNILENIKYLFSFEWFHPVYLVIAFFLYALFDTLGFFEKRFWILFFRLFKPMLKKEFWFKKKVKGLSEFKSQTLFTIGNLQLLKFCEFF